jgi:hypothetical protein
MKRCHRSAVALATLVSAGLIACGGGSDSGSGSSAGAGAASQGGSLPDVAAPRAGSAVASIQQMSGDAKSCLDLVKSERYAEAISPCERALSDAAGTSSAQVQQALAEAKAGVAEQTKAAALKSAADSMAGKDPQAAAEEATAGALKGFGDN